MNSPVGTFDLDFFQFDVVPGTQVNSVSYAFSNVTALADSTSFGLGMDPVGGLCDWDVDVLNDTSSVFIMGEVLPLGADTCHFDVVLWTSPESPSGGTWDYTLTFEVGSASVLPVPAAAWLFGSGLLGLIGIARKKAA